MTRLSLHRPCRTRSSHRVAGLLTALVALAPLHPALAEPAPLRVKVLHTGSMSSRASFAFQGGAFRDRRRFRASAVLVQHPRGTLLFDAGFGQDVMRHIRQTVPWPMRAVTRYQLEAPIGQALARAGVAPGQLTGVVLTHGHWDHVSGLQDLPGVPVWLNEAELAFSRSGDRSTSLLAGLLATGSPARLYRFSGGPYLGFPRSFDVFGDGTVVLVPAPGHTPGSIIAFLRLPGGRRAALVGDLAWQREGIERRVQRPWLARRLVDHDTAGVQSTLEQVHALQRSMPDLLVVPAHDERALDQLAR